jgi:hypothetical protein
VEIVAGPYVGVRAVGIGTNISAPKASHFDKMVSVRSLPNDRLAAIAGDDDTASDATAPDGRGPDLDASLVVAQSLAASGTTQRCFGNTPFERIAAAAAAAAAATAAVLVAAVIAAAAAAAAAAAGAATDAEHNLGAAALCKLIASCAASLFL